MDPTNGNAHVPGDLNGYIEYTNNSGPNIDPFTGKSSCKDGLGSGVSADYLDSHFGLGEY